MHQISKRMKNLVFTLLAVFAAMIGRAQDPQTDWAKRIGGTGDDRANSVTTDAKGNVIIAGRFRSSSIRGINASLHNSDSAAADILLVKLNKRGEVLWAQSAGGKGDDDATSCKTDKEGNIIVAGWFECATLAFGKSSVSNANPGKGCDLFIAKLSPDGECIWARSAGGKGSDGDYSACAVDKDNNIIVSGIFDSPVLEFGGVSLTNSGGSDMFIAKYAADGQVLWAKNAIGSDHDEGQSCSTDAEGNIFAGGYFTSPTLTLGSVTVTNTAEKSGDAFVAKLSSDGTTIWLKTIGGASTEIGNCFADPAGNVIIAGVFLSPTLTVGQTTLTNEGAGDLFVAKLTPRGDALWAKSAGGSSFEGVRSFYVDAKGNILITGSYLSAALVFGKDTLQNKAEGSEDIFIAQYSPNGEVLFAKSAGGAGRNCGRGITTDAGGNIFITGSFEEPSLAIDAITLTKAGSADIFLAKLGNKRASRNPGK